MDPTGLTNEEVVGRMLQLLKDGIFDFFCTHMTRKFGDNWAASIQSSLPPSKRGKPATEYDIGILISIILKEFNTVFYVTPLARDKNLIYEMRTIRNEWAHQKLFSDVETFRVLDVISQLIWSCYQHNNPGANFEHAMNIDRTKKLYLLKMAHKVANEIDVENNNLEAYRNAVYQSLQARHDQYQLETNIQHAIASQSDAMMTD